MGHGRCDRWDAWINMCVRTYMSACVGTYMCGCVLVCIFLYVCTYNVVKRWWLNGTEVRFLAVDMEMFRYPQAQVELDV